MNMFYVIRYQKLLLFGIIDLIGGILLIVIPTHLGITNIIGAVLAAKAFYMFNLHKRGAKHLSLKKNMPRF